jgi:AraC family transcriptional regulator
MVRKRQALPPGPKKLRTAHVSGFTLTEGIHPAGSSLPWHTHDGPTICFVLRGAFTEISAGETLACTPAMLKVTPAGERHWDRFDRGDARGLLIEAEPARAEALRPHAAVLDQHLAFHGGLPAAIARRIYEELRVMDDAAPLAIEGLVLELLAAATRRSNGGHAGGGGRPGWVLQARDFLHADLAARRTLSDLAVAVGVHPVTLARTFRRSFGCSVGEYLRRLRIERAAVQLGGSDAPLAAIALAAGFADQSHFSNLFRRETGMSPSAYRRAVRAG